MSKTKPFAAISLDLDNQWSYMKIHGDEGWDKYPSYFDIFIPHVLDLLDELEIKITFFIVGKDCEADANRKYLKMISDRGHEVGNHSYNHESWLQSYSYEEIEKEISEAEAAIEKATGQKPVGFRGPGFSWSMDLLKVLDKRGYLYDASTSANISWPSGTEILLHEIGSFKGREKRKKRAFWQIQRGIQETETILP